MSIFSSIAEAALAGLTGKIVGSVISGVTVTNEMIEKFFDSIEQKMGPIYSGDFDKVSKSLRSYRNTYLHGLSETEKEEYVNVKILENAIRFVDYYKYSLKPLPPENSEYDKALKNWRIFEEFKTAEKYFLNSIDKEEQTRTLAICDYIDFVSQKESNEHAVKELKKYIKLHGEHTALLEKAVVLYSLTNNTKQLHKTLTLLIDKKSNSKQETENLLLRLADCEYKLGNFKKSISTAKKAFDCGCWLFGYANQVVESYIALKEYDNARNFVDEIEAKFADKLKKIEKAGPYEIHSYDIPFYFRDRIKFAEKNKENNNLSFLDNDEFTQKCLIKTPVNEYELEAVKQRIDKIYNNLSGYPDSYNNIYYDKLYSEYLSGAYIRKHLYGKTELYYQYLSEGLFYSGVSFCGIADGYDFGRCYILSALKTGFMIEGNSLLERSTNNLYLGGYYGPTNVVDGLELKNIILMTIPQLHDKDYIEHMSDEECRLFKYSPVIRSNLMGDDEKYVLDEVDRRFIEAEEKYNSWLTAVKSDVTFNSDLTTLANKVKESIIVFESDKKFINKYLKSIAGMEEFYKYSDFDNRLIVAERALHKIENLESSIDRKGRETTIFFENYLRKVIIAAKTNLKNIIDSTKKDFATKITLEIPQTNVVPDDSGNVRLSISIANAENRAPAKNMKLSVENTTGQEIFHEDLSEKNLKGGTSISEFITIPAEGKEALGIKIKLSYDGGSVELSKQLTVDSSDFEKIKKPPYITGNPVEEDDMFFGRDELIERLAKSLKDDTTRCIVIYGQKRSGKSSIFRHLRKKLEDKFVVLSFSTGSDITSEMKFYRKVKTELERYLKCNNFDAETRKKWRDYTISDYLDFEQFVDEVSEEVCEPQNKELLLMIDEFTALYEYMKNPDYSLGKENFMDKWKAMSEQNLFKSALIGQDNMPEFIREYPNQFQVTDLIRVSYIERRYAKDLIVKPILLSNGKSRYLEGADDKIENWFNGQPFFIQQYCHKLVEYLNMNKENYITMAVAEHVKNEMLAECREASFDNLVYAKEGETCDADWTVLKKIASSDVEDVPVDISSLSENEKIALDKLTDREVLTKKQDRYTIKIPFFREWIREYK